MQTVVHDVRYGWRGFRSKPGFSLLAVLTLALGIGAATTIFSVIQNVLLDPFPYADADRIATIQIHDLVTGRPGGRSEFQTPEFLDYQEQNHVFDDVNAAAFEDVLLRTGEGTEQYNGAAVTGNTFTFLGVPALAGRVITPDDAKSAHPPYS
jgi:putative ABC transport system permease protein